MCIPLTSKVCQISGPNSKKRTCNFWAQFSSQGLICIFHWKSQFWTNSSICGWWCWSFYPLLNLWCYLRIRSRHSFSLLARLRIWMGLDRCETRSEVPSQWNHGQKRLYLWHSCYTWLNILLSYLFLKVKLHAMGHGPLPNLRSDMPPWHIEQEPSD